MRNLSVNGSYNSALRVACEKGYPTRHPDNVRFVSGSVAWAGLAPKGRGEGLPQTSAVFYNGFLRQRPASCGHGGQDVECLFQRCVRDQDRGMLEVPSWRGPAGAGICQFYSRLDFASTSGGALSRRYPPPSGLECRGDSTHPR